MFLKLLFRPNKNKLTVAYKLLHDILFIALAFFLFSLIAEGMLPGIITSYVEFSRVIIFIFVVITATYILGNYLGIRISDGKINKKTVYLLVFVLLLLVFNSLLKTNIILNLAILFFTAAIGYFTYLLIIERN